MKLFLTWHIILVIFDLKYEFVYGCSENSTVSLKFSRTLDVDTSILDLQDYYETEIILKGCNIGHDFGNSISIVYSEQNNLLSCDYLDVLPWLRNIVSKEQSPYTLNIDSQHHRHHHSNGILHQSYITAEDTNLHLNNNGSSPFLVSIVVSLKNRNSLKSKHSDESHLILSDHPFIVLVGIDAVLADSLFKSMKNSIIHIEVNKASMLKTEEEVKTQTAKAMLFWGTCGRPLGWDSIVCLNQSGEAKDLTGMSCAANSIAFIVLIALIVIIKARVCYILDIYWASKANAMLRQRAIYTLSQLKLVKYASADKSYKESICSICLEDFTENELVRVLECRHIFHQYCVDQWLLCKQLCPLCKYEIPDTAGFSLKSTF